MSSVIRRALASFLLAVFSFPLIAPAWVADADSQLPECCRRNGKHHCAMMADSSESAGGISIRALTPRCPLFPGALSSPARGTATVAPGSGAIFGAAVSHPEGLLQTEAGYRISLSRSSQKRGPPVLS